MEAKWNEVILRVAGVWLLPLQRRQERLLGRRRREGILRNTATATATACASAAASALVQAGRRAANGLSLSIEQVEKRGYSWVLRSDDRRVHEPWVPAQCALGGRATAYIGQAAVHRGQPEGCLLCLCSRHGRGRGRGTHRGRVHLCNQEATRNARDLRRPFFLSGIRRES